MHVALEMSPEDTAAPSNTGRIFGLGIDFRLKISNGADKSVKYFDMLVHTG